MKKIKLRKRRRFKYRILVYILLVFLGFEVSYNIIMNVKLAHTNEDFIKALLVDSNYHLLYEKKASNILDKAFTHVIDVNEPVRILENTFHYKTTPKKTNGYVRNPKTEETKTVININDKPLIYIYNSHQAEAYQGKALENYNITPGVMMASYIMQDKLAKQSVKALVLEDNLIDYMNLNNMKHSQSYKASRYFIEKTIKENETLKLIIDIHRDSIPKDKSTIIINNKPCAKIVFVVGNEYDSYEKNLETTNKLNEKIKEKYPNLTRGVLIKGGSGSNGVYNQDLNPNMTLMEIGAEENTISEVLNTIELITPIIKEYVNG